MTDLELQAYIQALIKYEENKIKSRRRFEKDLFIVFLVLFGIAAVILASCLKIENYLEYIMESLIAIEYEMK